MTCVRKVLFIVSLSFICSLQLNAGKIDEEYPLKESSTQGRLLRFNPPLKINYSKIASLPDPIVSWRYIVALNCGRGENYVRLIDELVTQLLPEDEQHRLSIILGINEKLTADRYGDELPQWEAIVPNDKKQQLEKHGIPILLHYVQWVAHRTLKDKSDPGAEAVLHGIQKEITSLSNKTRKNEIDELVKRDNKHGFPFGSMRTQVLNYKTSSEFIEQFHSQGTSVYIHIQDADFQTLQTDPWFTLKTLKIGKKNRSHYLFKKYDQIISERFKGAGYLPIIVGGAYVFDPKEDLSALGGEYDNGPSKQWTHFGNELGNFVKHIIGQHHPKGLYFHEPNTLILSPKSVKANLSEYKKALNLTSEEEKNFSEFSDEGFNKFKFGKCEVQDFTRHLFKETDTPACRSLMFFSCSTVLATSQKRSKDKTPFVITFKGTYKENKFRDWKKNDIASIFTIPQETLKSGCYGWPAQICTSFNSELDKGEASTNSINNLYGLFNPYYFYLNKCSNSGKKFNKGEFIKDLIQYDNINELRKEVIKKEFNNLILFYNKRGNGKVVATQIISLTEECGQAVRLMFLDHLVPEDTDLPDLEEVRNLLKARYEDKDRGLLPFPTPFVINFFTYLPKQLQVKATKEIKEHIEKKGLSE